MRKRLKKNAVRNTVLGFMLISTCGTSVFMYSRYIRGEPLRYDDIYLTVDSFKDDILTINIALKDEKYALTNWEYLRKGNACYIEGRKVPVSYFNKAQKQQQKVSMLLYDYAYIGGKLIWERPYR